MVATRFRIHGDDDPVKPALLPNKRLLKLFPLMKAVLSKAAAIAGTDSGTKTARNRLERQQKAPAGAGAQG